MKFIKALWLLLLVPFPLWAATADLTVGGSNGPISVAVGTPVSFDVLVDCGSSSDELIYVPGTAGPKGGDVSSEVGWDIRNDTASTIRIDSFGVSWDCVNDPGGVCSSWLFDYVKFEKNQPVIDPNKIFEAISPTDANNSFPLTTFDTNVGKTAPYQTPYLDIAPGETVQINEMEFVDSNGDKINPVPAGTSVEFTVTWGDSNGNTYIEIFTVTW